MSELTKNHYTVLKSLVDREITSVVTFQENQPNEKPDGAPADFRLYLGELRKLRDILEDKIVDAPFETSTTNVPVDQEHPDSLI
jgi:hypothetical protein